MYVFKLANFFSNSDSFSLFDILLKNEIRLPEGNIEQAGFFGLFSKWIQNCGRIDAAQEVCQQVDGIFYIFNFCFIVIC